ncbi:histidine kinase [Alcanivorax sp. S71-1-4]|uniref:sensor histidine kinase n=1 Tax=Alcanivorax sp. S71-1-4 TaxID=1177159 RepID=UPI00135A40B7|nr:sensor histidine kinase [Alcanivorax sp. S71-1-4]KAF0809408.1 histidine kinase [Alcanivorax sp. S71-1-4]
MIRLLCGLVLLLWMSDGPLAATPALHAEMQQVPLRGLMTVLHDAEGELSLANVSTPVQASRFTPVDGDFHGGFNRAGAFWLHTPLHVPPGEAPEWWLVLQAPWVALLDVYITRQGSAEPVWQRHTGLARPPESRDLRVGVIALRTPLPPGDYDLWMRLAGDRALSLEASFWQLQPFVEAHIRQEGILLNTLGMMLLMAVIGLIFGAHLRDGSLVWYGVYVGGVVCTSLGATGLISLVLPDSPELAARISGVAICVSILGATRVSVRIFTMVRWLPRVSFLLNTLGSLAGLGAVLSTFGLYDQIVGVINALAMVVCVMGTSAAYYVTRRHPTPDVVLYFLGMALYAILQMVIGLRFFNLYDSELISGWTQELLRTGHVFLVLLGMAVKITSLRRVEREAERERLKLASDMQASLERQVTERTRELNGELQARRAVEKKLSETLSEQRSFLAMVSHEFRTPLTVINLVAYNIGHRHADNPQTLEDVARVERANQRLVSLVDACLSNEWLDNATMQVNCSNRNLAPMLAELCEQRRIVTGRQIELVLPDGPVFVYIDAALVQVVFDNLIGNAIKYSPPHAPIHVLVHRFSSGAVEVAVSDRGPGIPANERTRVFERYYRSPTVLSHAGIGLGLHIVRRIVMLHGGDVWVDGTYMAGARFVVRFPPVTAMQVEQQGALH